MRKIFIGLVLLIILGGAAYQHLRHAKPAAEIAFADNREVTVWNTSAQVRAPIATVNYGDRLEILRRFQDQIEVRTMTGIRGWVSERDLLSEDLWQKAKDLDAQAARLPVEARGHTKVIGNLRLEPGRESLRIRQLSKGVSVDLLERSAIPVPEVKPASQSEDEERPPADVKKEDWWLVQAHTPDEGAMSGWILGRFVQLDVPEPLPDYASSADMRIVAWFELNRSADQTGGLRPQYLVLGTRGAEGQVCDFNLLRVYTWGKQRSRYETAFVESDVCGKLPVKLTRATAPGGDVDFSFDDLSNGAPETRVYRMQGTIVRRANPEVRTIRRKSERRPR